MLKRLMAGFVALAVLFAGGAVPALAVEAPEKIDFYQWAFHADGIPDCVWDYFSGDADSPLSSDLADAYVAYTEAIPVSSYTRFNGADTLSLKATPHNCGSCQRQ